MTTLPYATKNSLKEGLISQNGVKFRTLCGKCNNDLLDLRYDPELIPFTECVAPFLKLKKENNFDFPLQKVEVKTQRLL